MVHIFIYTVGQQENIQRLYCALPCLRHIWTLSCRCSKCIHFGTLRLWLVVRDRSIDLNSRVKRAEKSWRPANVMGRSWTLAQSVVR